MEAPGSPHHIPKSFGMNTIPATQAAPQGTTFLMTPCTTDNAGTTTMTGEMTRTPQGTTHTTGTTMTVTTETVTRILTEIVTTTATVTPIQTLTDPGIAPLIPHHTQTTPTPFTQGTAGTPTAGGQPKIAGSPSQTDLTSGPWWTMAMEHPAAEDLHQGTGHRTDNGQTTHRGRCLRGQTP